MRKSLFAALLLICSVATVHATQVIKVGFQAWSSSSQVECSIFGQGPKLRTDSSMDAQMAIQGFSPDPDYSRTLSLGTKGLSNYSTVYPSKNITDTKSHNIIFMQWDCRVKGTITAAMVKVYFNGIQTFYQNSATGGFNIGY
jgi:hypothetical protein